VPSDRDTEEVERSVVWRYLPTGAAVFAAANFALMWFGTRGTSMWFVSTGLAALAFVVAVTVQIEAIYKHPERYPEVVRRVE